MIRLTAGHHAVVEDKPEVKKAGGVFYTPTYIVEYIVKNTVGKLLGYVPPPQPSPSGGGGTSSSPQRGEARSGVTPKDVAKLRILDPACGSGSFLLGAYQYLLDWHLLWYMENDPTKWAKTKQPPLYQGYGGAWRLTTTERKRILLNNIYGVDIDSQAVEVTKLSLLLKVLEGETGESINKQLSFFHERALPDLSSNIKCGNSLIGPDFYDQKSLSFLDEEERYRVNVFDWEREFAEVFKAGRSQIPLNPPLPKGDLKTRAESGTPPFEKGGEGGISTGGFDAVIGNPPYVRQESLGASKEYLKGHYASFDGVVDLYVYFMEKGVRLLRLGGMFGIIVSSSFLRTRFAAPLRTWLKEKSAVEKIVDFGGLPVFANTTQPSSSARSTPPTGRSTGWCTSCTG